MAIDLNDKTSNANNLTNNGATESATVPSVVNDTTSVLLNGSSQYLSAGTSTTLEPASQFTVEAWFYRTGTANATIFACIGQASNYGGIELDVVNNLLRLFACDNSGTNGGVRVDMNGATSLGTGTWYHGVASFDGGTYSLLLNGTVENTTASNVPVAYNANTKCYVGVRSYDAGTTLAQYFPGNIDEVRVWGTARTSTQITNSKNVQLIGNETGLNAYWPFNSLAAAGGLIGGEI